MRVSLSLTAFCLAVFAPLAGAYEYPLQFTPNPGYRGLVVAGYKFVGNDVVGSCSYYTVSGLSSGKGGHAPTTGVKNYQQTCTWDSFGNLLSVAPGAPPVPTALDTDGSKIIYASNGNGDTTGTDAKLPERGFVNTPGAHYTWLTPNINAVLIQIVYTSTVTLKSDGDGPVNITAVAVSAGNGKAALKSTTCIGKIDVGKTCSVTYTYDPTKVTSTTDLASDTLRIDLTSDAGEANDFVQKLTIILPKI